MNDSFFGHSCRHLKHAPWLGAPRARERHDRLIPMINVVFLLLLFFVIAGTFRAGDLLPVEPPEINNAGGVDAGNMTVLVSKSGEMAIASERMERDIVVARVSEWLERRPHGIVHIKADRESQAAVIVPLLAELAEAGVAGVRLIAVRGRNVQ